MILEFLITYEEYLRVDPSFKVISKIGDYEVYVDSTDMLRYVLHGVWSKSTYISITINKHAMITEDIPEQVFKTVIDIMRQRIKRWQISL